MARFKTIVLGLGVLSALGLSGYAIAVMASSDVPFLEGLLGEVEPEVVDAAEAEQRRQRLSAMARGLQSARGPSVFDDAEEPPPPVDPNTTITPEDARSGFDYVMRQVERMGRKRRRLSQDEWEETWRAANDAYAALSIELDATDPAQLAELEQAHQRLKRGLERVRVRGGKFKS